MTDMIARLRQLEAAATPGPWEWFDDGADSTGMFPAASGLRNKTGQHVLSGDAVGAAGSGWINSSDEDSTLIAAARNALPQLLDGMDILVQMVKTRDEYDEAFQTRDWQTCERIEYESEHDDLHQRAKSLLAALDSQETE